MKVNGYEIAPWSALRGANLREADLSGADLRWANLRWANLSGANLRGADLRGANLIGANLREANLIGANLRQTRLPEGELRILPDDGDVIGWKKLRSNHIARLLIPGGTARSNATGRKCRAQRAKVLAIYAPCGAPHEIGVSQHDPAFMYRVGEWVSVSNFDPDRWNECAPGIHFFITRKEAEEY
jgi:hypothetical protein